MIDVVVLNKMLTTIEIDISGGTFLFVSYEVN